MHIDDFSLLLRDPFAHSPGWRLWRADTCFDAQRLDMHIPLPPWLAVLNDEGVLVPAPPEDGWMRLLSVAPALAFLAVENGATEDEVVATPALFSLLRSLRAAPVLRSLAVGFFSAAGDEALQPLLRLRTLTRLELSHLPHVTDEFVCKACRTLGALAALRLDNLAISDAALSHLDRPRALSWLEIRVRQ